MSAKFTIENLPHQTFTAAIVSADVVETEVGTVVHQLLTGDRDVSYIGGSHFRTGSLKIVAPTPNAANLWVGILAGKVIRLQYPERQDLPTRFTVVGKISRTTRPEESGDTPVEISFEFQELVWMP